MKRYVRTSSSVGAFSSRARSTARSIEFFIASTSCPSTTSLIMS